MIGFLDLIFFQGPFVIMDKFIEHFNQMVLPEGKERERERNREIERNRERRERERGYILSSSKL